MQLQELLRDERAEGRREELAKNILFILEERKMSPDEFLRQVIMSEQDLEYLDNLKNLSFKVHSLEEFVQKMR